MTGKAPWELRVERLDELLDGLELVDELVAVDLELVDELVALARPRFSTAGLWKFCADELVVELADDTGAGVVTAGSLADRGVELVADWGLSAGVMVPSPPSSEWLPSRFCDWGLRW